MRRVVVTGMGIYSCIGKNIDDVAKSLYEGRSGIGVEVERTEYGYRSPLTGIVERPQLKGVLDRRLRIGLAEEGEYAYMATLEAFKGAKIDADYLENNEIGIFYGNDSSAKAVIEANNIAMEKHDTSLIGSGAIFQSMNSTVTMNLSTIFKLRGVNMTISAACASGSHSIGLGYLFIKQGLQDVVLCGGAQETNLYSMGSFDALGAFSVRIAEPQKASRPFDKSRDGLVPSGGAASLILEEYEHAKARGANILCELTGYGATSDGYDMVQPSGEGAVRCMQMALAQHGGKVDYINAHGTSTPVGDTKELGAIREVFAGQEIPFISSTKSLSGHALGAAGSNEAIYSILMMQNDFACASANIRNLDEQAEGLPILRENREMKLNAVMSNSFGFGGTNATLIFSRVD